jgi:phage tail-like protein
MSDYYPPAAFHFEVRFAAGWGQSDASFQEVGGIGPELTTEDYREGGENRFRHALPTGVKNPKLSLKRGIADKDSQLVKWCKDVLEGGLLQPITTRDLSLVLLDESGDALRYWKFVNAYPCHWTVDTFQADKNAVAIEKIELIYASSERRF